jgi:succinoglycan biosynthesis protein ExoM
MEAGIPEESRRIDVLICTHRRSHVGLTIASIHGQAVPDGVSLAIIVVDNDKLPSALPLVAAARTGPWPITYVHAPGDNISLARNACLDASRADIVAFIDDDETAAPDWIARLLTRLDETGADAVFGPSIAVYPADAPDWMRAQDHHSNRPVRRAGVVETGHTCNALVRVKGVPWAADRFDLARGRSGGEDTEYFFRLARRGARFEIAGSAHVFEPVHPDRLDLDWLERRKFRMGQSYASLATGPAARAWLLIVTTAKIAYCRGRKLAAPNAEVRAFWRLRAALHCGVQAACRGRRDITIYGSWTPGFR